jgi:alpha-ketoglutarate-dependent taurine dioxygenase
LSAYHSLRYSQGKLGFVAEQNDGYSGYGLDVKEPPLRPLVKVHPETSRKALTIGRHAYGIPGMSQAQSEALLDELCTFACQPPRTYHHHWTAGDIVVWDNRCLMHRACPWDMRQPRVMYHSRIAGDPVSEAALAA